MLGRSRPLETTVDQPFAAVGVIPHGPVDPSGVVVGCRSEPRRSSRPIAPGSQRVLGMDRSIGRFLCLPVFDGEFREALARLQLDHVEFWLALADGDQGADDRLSGLLPALTEDDAVRGSILNRLELVNILAAMVKASAARISREIAADLGYGAADLAGPGATSAREAARRLCTARSPRRSGASPEATGRRRRWPRCRARRRRSAAAGGSGCKRSALGRGRRRGSMTRDDASGGREAPAHGL